MSTISSFVINRTFSDFRAKTNEILERCEEKEHGALEVADIKSLLEGDELIGHASAIRSFSSEKTDYVIEKLLHWHEGICERYSASHTTITKASLNSRRRILMDNLLLDMVIGILDKPITLSKENIDSLMQFSFLRISLSEKLAHSHFLSESTLEVKKKAGILLSLLSEIDFPRVVEGYITRVEEIVVEGTGLSLLHNVEYFPFRIHKKEQEETLINYLETICDIYSKCRNSDMRSALLRTIQLCLSNISSVGNEIFSSDSWKNTINKIGTLAEGGGKSHQKNISLQTALLCISSKEYFEKNYWKMMERLISAAKEQSKAEIALEYISKIIIKIFEHGIHSADSFKEKFHFIGNALFTVKQKSTSMRFSQILQSGTKFMQLFVDVLLSLCIMDENTAIESLILNLLDTKTGTELQLIAIKSLLALFEVEPCRQDLQNHIKQKKMQEKMLVMYSKVLGAKLSGLLIEHNETLGDLLKCFQKKTSHLLLSPEDRTRAEVLARIFRFIPMVKLSTITMPLLLSAFCQYTIHIHEKLADEASKVLFRLIETSEDRRTMVLSSFVDFALSIPIGHAINLSVLGKLVELTASWLKVVHITKENRRMVHSLVEKIEACALVHFCDVMTESRCIGYEILKQISAINKASGAEKQVSRVFDVISDMDASVFSRANFDPISLVQYIDPPPSLEISSLEEAVKSISSKTRFFWPNIILAVLTELISNSCNEVVSMAWGEIYTRVMKINISRPKSNDELLEDEVFHQWRNYIVFTCRAAELESLASLEREEAMYEFEGTEDGPMCDLRELFQNLLEYLESPYELYRKSAELALGSTSALAIPTLLEELERVKSNSSFYTNPRKGLEIACYLSGIYITILLNNKLTKKEYQTRFLAIAIEFAEFFAELQRTGMSALEWSYFDNLLFNFALMIEFLAKQLRETDAFDNRQELFHLINGFCTFGPDKREEFLNMELRMKIQRMGAGKEKEQLLRSLDIHNRAIDVAIVRAMVELLNTSSLFQEIHKGCYELRWLFMALGSEDLEVFSSARIGVEYVLQHHLYLLPSLVDECYTPTESRVAKGIFFALVNILKEIPSYSTNDLPIFFVLSLYFLGSTDPEVRERAMLLLHSITKRSFGFSSEILQPSPAPSSRVKANQLLVAKKLAEDYPDCSSAVLNYAIKRIPSCSPYDQKTFLELLSGWIANIRWNSKKNWLRTSQFLRELLDLSFRYYRIHEDIIERLWYVTMNTEGGGALIVNNLVNMCTCFYVENDEKMVETCKETVYCALKCSGELSFNSLFVIFIENREQIISDSGEGEALSDCSPKYLAEKFATRLSPGEIDVALSVGDVAFIHIIDGINLPVESIVSRLHILLHYALLRIDSNPTLFQACKSLLLNSVNSFSGNAGNARFNALIRTISSLELESLTEEAIYGIIDELVPMLEGQADLSGWCAFANRIGNHASESKFLVRSQHVCRRIILCGQANETLVDDICGHLNSLMAVTNIERAHLFFSQITETLSAYVNFVKEEEASDIFWILYVLLHFPVHFGIRTVLGIANRFLTRFSFSEKVKSSVLFECPFKEKEYFGLLPFVMNGITSSSLDETLETIGLISRLIGHSFSKLNAISAGNYHLFGYVSSILSLWLFYEGKIDDEDISILLKGSSDTFEVQDAETDPMSMKIVHDTIMKALNKDITTFEGFLKEVFSVSPLNFTVFCFHVLSAIVSEKQAFLHEAVARTLQSIILSSDEVARYISTLDHSIWRHVVAALDAHHEYIADLMTCLVRIQEPNSERSADETKVGVQSLIGKKKLDEYKFYGRILSDYSSFRAFEFISTLFAQLSNRKIVTMRKKRAKHSSSFPNLTRVFKETGKRKEEAISYAELYPLRSMGEKLNLLVTDAPEIAHSRHSSGHTGFSEETDGEGSLSQFSTESEPIRENIFTNDRFSAGRRKLSLSQAYRQKNDWN